jgi:hypothetical protein
MTRLWLAVLTTLLVSCAHLGGQGEQTAARADLWHDAHTALYERQFARADSVFTRLAQAHPNSDEGREAIFYLGSIYLDPRNPAMESQRAETHFRQYLDQDTVGTLIHRRPEATALLELARQLNLPVEERAAALRDGYIVRLPATPAGQTPPPPPRPAGPLDAQALLQDNQRLRQMLQQRDDEIRRQQAELERIRRALSPRGATP